MTACKHRRLIACEASSSPLFFGCWHVHFLKMIPRLVLKKHVSFYEVD